MRPNHLPINKQAGVMLIILMMFIVLASLTVLMTQLSGRAQKNLHDQQTDLALAEAKAALIGYAITYDDAHPGELYGYLPCPDTDADSDPSGEGAQSICGNQNVSVLGRLPWKTLKLAPLRDGAGECLWYAVSGNFKNNPKVGLSFNSLGLFEVQAANGSYLAGPADRAVAVVFAAGPALSGQNRSADPNAERCGGNYGTSNYLDTDIFTARNNAAVTNAPSGISNFAAAENSQLTTSNDDQFNDRLLLIRKSDIFAAYCKKYVNTLLTNITLTTNSCNASDPAVTPKLPTVACSNAVEYLGNCTLIGKCYAAANALLTSDCLADMTSTGCQSALIDLKGCNG